MPLVHIDPSRRDEASNRRSWRLEDLQPGLDSITPIVEASQGAALKLGPGIPRDMVPPDPQGTIEFISEGRTLLQAVAWCGSLATPGCARRATDVVAQTSIEGDPQPPPFRGSVGSRLLVPHPAVERAELMSVALGSSDAGELAAGLGILTTDTPTFSPWFEEFEVLEMLPPPRREGASMVEFLRCRPSRGAKQGQGDRCGHLVEKNFRGRVIWKWCSSGSGLSGRLSCSRLAEFLSPVPLRRRPFAGMLRSVKAHRGNHPMGVCLHMSGRPPKKCPGFSAALQWQD